MFSSKNSLIFTNWRRLIVLRRYKQFGRCYVNLFLDINQNSAHYQHDFAEFENILGLGYLKPPDKNCLRFNQESHC